MKTTKADFKYFCERCEYWVGVLGVNDWEINFSHEELDGLRAQFRGNPTSRVAALVLATDWKHMRINKEELNNTARHEVCHLFLGEIAGIAQARYATEEEMLNAEHAVVNRLIKVLMK